MNKRSVALSPIRTIFLQFTNTKSITDLQIRTGMIDSWVPLVQFVHSERIGMRLPDMQTIISWGHTIERHTYITSVDIRISLMYNGTYEIREYSQ